MGGGLFTYKRTMKCDACSKSIKYNENYIYKKTEWIKFCLECSWKYIDNESIKNDPTEDWRISIYE